MGLAGYSPWGCKESDTTEVTQHTDTQEARLTGDVSHEASHFKLFVMQNFTDKKDTGKAKVQRTMKLQ